MTAGVVIGIDGTMTPAAFTDWLVSYARARLYDLVVHPTAADRDQVADVVADVRRTLRQPEADRRAVAEILQTWSDHDRKMPALWTLQMMIWRRGFAVGDLIGTVFPDVPGALRGWRTAGVPLYVYSTLSTPVQRLWSSHCAAADLSAVFSAYFETRTTGAKTDRASYERIADGLGAPGSELVYLSGVRAELDAARAAAWTTIGVHRAEGSQSELGDHSCVAGFEQLELTRGRLPRIRGPVGESRRLTHPRRRV